jgi:Spy/CpxP family protein refolding chaperone
MLAETTRRIPVIGLALLLPALLFAAPATAQQDTAQARSRMMRRGMHRMHEGGTMGMMGQMGAMRMGADHVGPRLLIDLKSELQLSDDQVARLEKIRDEHHSVMQGMHENMMDLREKMWSARSENDWSALENLIDQRADLQARIAKSLLNVERQSLDVLSADQRQKVETWQQGHRLLRRHLMPEGRGMMGPDTTGPGMRRR